MIMRVIYEQYVAPLKPIEPANREQLWRNLKPNTELATLVTKQWQDVSALYTTLSVR